MKGKALAILLAILLLTGCVRRPVSFTLDGSGNYTGFSQVEEGYTRKAAKFYGWVVLEDLAITENVQVWQQFLKRTAAGKEAGGRIDVEKRGGFGHHPHGVDPNKTARIVNFVTTAK